LIDFEFKVKGSLMTFYDMDRPWQLPELVLGSFLSLKNEYALFMTQLLERAINSARSLPAEMQDDIARIILALSEDKDSAYHLSSEEEASLEASIAQAENGQFASDVEVNAVWSKHGL